MWEESGGFINDTTNGEPQQLSHSVSVGGDDKNKAIAAVSISQIIKLTRPNEGLIIHKRKIHHVNLVAFVYEILDINAQKIHVLLDDFTSGGPLEVNHIIGDTGTPGDDSSLSMFNDSMGEIQDENQSRNLNSLKAGDYVRCVGVLKFNQDKPNLVAYNMRIVEDPNEVTMHTLEVIRDSMYYERLQANGGNFVQPPTSEPVNSNFNQQSRNTGFGNLSTRDRHLLKFLREKAPESGMKLDEITANFKAFTKKDIEESLLVLSSEGMCWQGDTEDCWCVNPQGD